jgi:glucokinase
VKRSTNAVLAIDLGGTKIASAVVSPAGRVSEERDEAVDLTSPRAPLEQMVRRFRDLAGAGQAIAAAGVAVPGLVRRDGTVWAPNLPGWEKFPLARELRRRLRVPVAVESDRNAVVLGEAWRGAARGKKDVIVLIIGTGIGAGILSDGRLVRGAHELSGCAGWMVVTDESGERAREVGALESLTAGPAIARAAGGGSLTAATVAEAARRGRRRERDLLLRAGRRLGLAVANLASLFDPEIIVLTGGVALAADVYLEELKRTARAHAQPLSIGQIEIVPSELGARANLLGAARIAFQAAADRDRKSETRS